MKEHRSKTTTIDQGYENLANAIILLAVEDYRKILKWLSKNFNDRSALSKKQHIERFFRSGWFATLTDIDPEGLIKRLNSEVER